MAVQTESEFTSVTCVNSAGSLASASYIPMCNYAGGIFSIPTGSSITTLTFYVSDKSDGTYQALYSSAGAAVSVTVAADKSYVQDVSLNVAPYVKIVANAAGTVNYLGKTL